MNMQNEMQIVKKDGVNGKVGAGACPEASPSQARLEQLEGLIFRNRLQYVAVGLALNEINQKGLYKPYAETFEDYMEQRFSITSREGYYIIASAKTAVEVDDYSDLDDDPLKIFMNQSSRQKPIILDNERKARALSGLNAKEKRQAAQDAYRKAVSENRTLTARDIEEEASKYKPPKVDKVPDLEKARDSLDKELGKISDILIKVAEKYPTGKDKQDFFAEYIVHVEQMLIYLKENKDK